MKKNNIILMGFMGVGKGTIARALAQSCNIFAIDSDDLIESLENRKIKTIFETDGESYFREIEQKCANWIESCVNNSIISVGGGFYRRENFTRLGKIVYLRSSFDGILKRINEAPNAQKKLKKRPLLQDLQKAQELYNQRVEQYESIADIIVDVENKSIESIVEDILKQARKDEDIKK